MIYEESCIYKTYSYFWPGLCLNIFGYTFNQILNIKIFFGFLFREALKKTIESLTAVIPTLHPPPLSLTALGFFGGGLFIC